MRGAHTLRGGVDARLAQRQRGLGGNPSGQLTFTNEFTRQASDTSQLTPSNLGLSLAAFMLGIPSTSQATIQPTINLRNHFFAAYAQDSWRLRQPDGQPRACASSGRTASPRTTASMIVGLRPERDAGDLQISPRRPTPGRRFRSCRAASFRVRGGSIYATDPGQDGKVWRPQTMWMPRVSAVYKLGEKTVLKGGYGLYYDTLNAADYNQNNDGLQRDDDQHQQHRLRPDVPARQSRTRDSSAISDPFPVRADGTRFDEPTGATLGVDTIAGSSDYTDPESEPRARAPAAVADRRAAGAAQEPVGGSGLRRLVFGSCARCGIRQDYLPQQYWIPGSLNARDTAAQALLTANVTNPYTLANFAALRTTDPVLYQRMSANGFFTADDRAAATGCCGRSRRSTT